MEQKYREFKKFDWTLSDKWQNYLNNIFPTPSRDVLEKIRRKWYKNNIDKDFDINYQPSGDGGDDSGANARPRPNAQNAY